MNTKVQNKANFLAQRQQTIAKRSNFWHGARRFRTNCESGYIMPFTLPRTRVKFGNQAFAVAGSEAWTACQSTSGHPKLSLHSRVAWRHICLNFRTARDDSSDVVSDYESSRKRASSTGDSLVSGKVSYTGWTLSTGFGSESASRCSDVCTRWLLNTCLPTAKLPTRLRHLWHLWPSPPAIGWPWLSRFPTCETCFVRRTFICIRRPFELELTSCVP